MYQDANTFNETLTIFAQGFMAQRADSLIDCIAPYVSTGTASGDYKLFDKNDPFQIYDDTVIPEDGESQTVHFNASTDKYDCEPHGLKIPIRDWERKQAGEKGFALMRNGKLNTLLSTQLVNREYKGWAKIRAAVTAASGKGAWSGTAGADKDPVDELDALIEKINNDTGSMPEYMAWGLSAWRVFKNHPKVLSRLSGIKASATVDDVRGMLLNPNMDIRIGSMPVNTAKLGKAAVKKGILGADVFIFHKSESPTTEDMSAVKTFTIDAPGVAEVHTLRDDLNHREFDEVLWSEDLRITAPIAIQRISVA